MQSLITNPLKSLVHLGGQTTDIGVERIGQPFEVSIHGEPELDKDVLGRASPEWVPPLCELEQTRMIGWRDTWCHISSLYRERRIRDMDRRSRCGDERQTNSA
ncbi:hypothetical protein [Williamsia muralis]|uniref:hypothetical protein n=1 Tax=Williamsia marianensis TaxID=85044 RepID=UPI00381A39A6